MTGNPSNRVTSVDREHDIEYFLTLSTWFSFF